MYVCTMRLRAHSCTKKSEKKLSSYETLYFVVHLGQHCLLTQIAELKFAILVAIHLCLQRLSICIKSSRDHFHQCICGREKYRNGTTKKICGNRKKIEDIISRASAFFYSALSPKKHFKPEMLGHFFHTEGIFLCRRGEHSCRTPS